MPVVAGMCRRAFARDGRGQRGWRGSEPPPAREESSLLAPEEPSAFRPRKAHRAVPSCGLAGAHARERAASRWDRRLGFSRPPLRFPHKKSLALQRERRDSFGKFGGLGFRYRGHSDRRL